MDLISLTTIYGFQIRSFQRNEVSNRRLEMLNMGLQLECVCDVPSLSSSV